MFSAMEIPKKINIFFYVRICFTIDACYFLLKTDNAKFSYISMQLKPSAGDDKSKKYKKHLALSEEGTP